MSQVALSSTSQPNTSRPNASNITPIDVISKSYTQLKTHFDRKYGVVWCSMQPSPRPCFTRQLLGDLNAWFDHFGKVAERQEVQYHVITGADNEVFNLGGDLALFRELSRRGDRDALMRYATECIDALYANMTGCHQDVTTISLVRGCALGGGFEAALSSGVIIAEAGAQLGFPEILFNLFPGMGAYSLLSRKIGPKQAERLILSGKLYSAEELYEMGVIDLVVEPGTGEAAVYDYIKRENRARNGFRAMRKVRDCVHPITREELLDVTTLWVEAALKLTDRDLRMMERLVGRQQQLKTAAAG